MPRVRLDTLLAERGLFGRRMPGIGSALDAWDHPGFAEDIISALEARALWARYGL